MRWKWFLGILIFLFALFVRFYNFSDRVTFGPEQAISLMASGEVLQGQFSLLGLPNLQRFTSGGYQLFSGAWFTYSLVPIHILFNGDPILITGYFVLLNVFTGLIFFWLVKITVDFQTAMIFLILFLFNSLMIYHSLFIWILNYLPLVGGLSCYLLYKIKKKPKRQIYMLFLGVLSGLGFNLEYFYLFSALILLGLAIAFSRKKARAIFWFLAGAIIGNLPMVVFDLRHDLYHVKTLWRYFLDMFAYPSNQNLSYYHFLNWLPLALLFLAIFFQKHLQGRKMILVMSLYIVLNLFSRWVAFDKAVGMPDGLTWQKIDQVAKGIANDSPKDFNVVTLLDFDTRGHVLRYPLQYFYHQVPLGVESYQEAGVVYALAKNNYDFDSPKVWELQALAPYKVQIIGLIEPFYGVYKLTKE